MQFDEAADIVMKLLPYTGRVMKPFHAPVKKMLIVPAAQQDFDRMMEDMQQNSTPLDKAIQPYTDNVTILVCFDISLTEGVTYCHYDYFLFQNNITL